MAHSASATTSEKLNDVSTFYGYSMPQVGELLDRLGRTQYILTLDLTKGYWQVPLTPSSWEKTVSAPLVATGITGSFRSGYTGLPQPSSG